jgi:hypothetical protein
MAMACSSFNYQYLSRSDWSPDENRYDRMRAVCGQNGRLIELPSRTALRPENNAMISHVHMSLQCMDMLPTRLPRRLLPKQY